MSGPLAQECRGSGTNVLNIVRKKGGGAGREMLRGDRTRI